MKKRITKNVIIEGKTYSCFLVRVIKKQEVSYTHITDGGEIYVSEQCWDQSCLEDDQYWMPEEYNTSVPTQDLINKDDCEIIYEEIITKADPDGVNIKEAI